MPLAQFVMSEVSPAAAGTALSSQPVTGVSVGMPVGVCGRIDDYRSVRLFFEIAANASGGTLDVVAQSSPDGGASWFDAVRLPQRANAAAAISYSVGLSLETGTAAPVAVGKNSVPALAANVVINGSFGDRLRLAMTAGAGASAGVAVVVRVSAQRPRLREAGGR